MITQLRKECERDYFEAIDGEKAAEDAFLEASTEDDYIILFIHGRLRLKEEEE